MKLYLVQHGKAASKDVDPDRHLTEQGRKELQKVCGFIKNLSLAVNCIWHSGKTRAEETADALAKVIKVNEETASRDDLGPKDDVKTVRDELVLLQKDVMIVAHLPFLDKLASLLLAGDEDRGTVDFQNGGVVCLSNELQNQWQLEWIVTPELLV